MGTSSGHALQAPLHAHFPAVHVQTEPQASLHAAVSFVHVLPATAGVAQQLLVHE